MEVVMPRWLIASLLLAVTSALAPPATQAPADLKKSAPTKEETPLEERGFFGILPGADSKSGLIVEEVTPDGPAAKAGVKDGDKIIKLNDKEVKNSDELRKRLGNTKPGQTLAVTIKRGDKEMMIRVTLGKRPAFAGVRVDAEPDKGFSWAYYLYVPVKLRDRSAAKTCTILVRPNNTGQIDDDAAVHGRAARNDVTDLQSFADRLAVVVLEPTFPRPKSDWQIYTHALNRATLLTDKPRLVRIDRQLEAMIDHAAARLAAEGMAVDHRVLLFGFSASGMFANRFTFLHPERIKAAAIGSPGGWPLAPASYWHGKTLPYPIGVADVEAVAGKPFDAAAAARVPMFLFMGDQDTNDSVIFRDSYSKSDENLIGELFGKTPVSRWPFAERLYREVLPRAIFKEYPGVGHKVTKQMLADVQAFFASELAK
jgi:pimeloyl-ACP methyl ester carboxylesterase